MHARGAAMPKFIPGRGPNAKRAAELERSAELLREALQTSRQVLGARHLETLISSSNLGSCLRSLGETADEEEASGLIKDFCECKSYNLGSMDEFCDQLESLIATCSNAFAGPLDATVGQLRHEHARRPGRFSRL